MGSCKAEWHSGKGSVTSPEDIEQLLGQLNADEFREAVHNNQSVLLIEDDNLKVLIIPRITEGCRSVVRYIQVICVGDNTLTSNKVNTYEFIQNPQKKLRENLCNQNGSSTYISYSDAKEGYNLILSPDQKGIDDSVILSIGGND